MGDGATMSFDWKGVVSKVAPMIGASLGGPMGAMGVSAALTALGIEPAPNSEDNERLLEETLQTASPDQLLALRTADNKFKISMKKLGLNEKQMGFDDVANARQRETNVGGNTTPMMGWTLVLGGFGFLGIILFNPVVVDKILLGTIIGMLISEIRQVTAYYFGSSSGQDFKTSEK